MYALYNSELLPTAVEPTKNYSYSSVVFLCNVEKCSLQALKSIMNQGAVHYLPFL